MRKFILNSNRFAELINDTYGSSSCTKCFTKLLKSLPSLYEFWTEVTIDSHDSCLKSTCECEQNVNLFHKRGKHIIFTNTHFGDGETFYLNCA